MLYNNSLQRPIIMSNQNTLNDIFNNKDIKISKKRCNVPSCKKKITLIGQICPYCNIGFCLSHCRIEDHQCPNAHHCRKQERDTNSKNLIEGDAKFKKLDKI